MQKLNLFSDEYTLDGGEPDGFLTRALRVGAELGAQALAVKAFELPPGQAVCPYHYEYEEEWLIVLDGSVQLRSPAGEEQLVAGDVVCFPPGPQGAHAVRNGGETSARVLMFSSAREPAVAVYPDSDKIGVWPGNEEDQVMLRRSDGELDYWDGES
jgi:uncharacterized cupin superfamily protein